MTQAVPILLKDALPEFADELEGLLNAEGHSSLAEQVATLRILDRCRCGDDFCATFYTQPKPRGAFGSLHRNVELEPEEGMIILDIVNSIIACVEVLYRDDVRSKLLVAMP